jgi:hypothetical protein
VLILSWSCLYIYIQLPCSEIDLALHYFRCHAEPWVCTTWTATRLQSWKQALWCRSICPSRPNPFDSYCASLHNCVSTSYIRLTNLNILHPFFSLIILCLKHISPMT